MVSELDGDLPLASVIAFPNTSPELMHGNHCTRSASVARLLSRRSAKPKWARSACATLELPRAIWMTALSTSRALAPGPPYRVGTRRPSSPARRNRSTAPYCSTRSRSAAASSRRSSSTMAGSRASRSAVEPPRGSSEKAGRAATDVVALLACAASMVTVVSSQRKSGMILSANRSSSASSGWNWSMNSSMPASWNASMRSITWS